MITFADAKRIIKTVELNHAEESKFIDLFIELFTMLEESVAEQVVDLQNLARNYECQTAELEAVVKKQRIELEEINKAFHDLAEEKDKFRKTLHECEELKEAEPKAKRGRPKRKPEEVKAETYDSDLKDLNETFSVHELARDIFSGEDD